MFDKLPFTPGGIPCKISELIQSKKKTVGVHLLLKKKRRYSKKMSSKEDSNVGLNKQRKRMMSETEKLIRDTLLHESKSISPSSTSLVVNGLLDFTKPRNKTNIRNSRASDVGYSLMCNTKKRKLDGEASQEHNIRDDKRSNGNMKKNSVIGTSIFNAKNTLRDSGEGDHIICHMAESFMKIVLNNTARHNVLTTNVCKFHFIFRHAAS